MRKYSKNLKTTDLMELSIRIGWESGIYYLHMTASGKNLGSGKVIVKK